MKVYRTISVPVMAEQFFPDKKPWPESVYDIRGGSLIGATDPYRVSTYGLPSRTCWQTISEGSWVVKWEDGRFESFPDEVFHRKFTPLGGE